MMASSLQPLGVDVEQQHNSVRDVSDSRRRTFGLGLFAGFACMGLAVVALSHNETALQFIGVGSFLRRPGQTYSPHRNGPDGVWIAGQWVSRPGSGYTKTQMTAIDEIDTHGSVMTLSRYMIEQAKQSKDMQEMESLMTSIQFACKQIAALVARAGISDLTGLEAGGGSVNVQGEEQKKLDVISNTVMKNALRYSGKVGVVGSEGEDDPVLVEEAFGGRYAAVFDPLDGSSNVDAAIATGTIFGIFDEEDAEECVIEDGAEMTEEQLQCLATMLQPGRRLVAAGYCMYSSSTILVMTLGNGVNGFTLDQTIGEFVLTHPNLKIPNRGKIYSINEANEPDWEPALRDHVQNLKTGKGESGEKYTSRYIGSMVGDVHRTLLYGGLFGYPGDAKNPNGKLRLVYEGAPMSFILEQAGGKSTTGSQRIMDISPSAVHQRVPVFLGSPDDIDEVVKVYEKAGIKTEY
jgi:fructose-1,6-bisphosphatase I